MDAITHTILALTVIAVAYYGGRWLQVQEARRMWGSIATPEIKREIQLMNALIERMSREDDHEFEHQAQPESEPLQLELFREYNAYGYSPSE